MQNILIESCNGYLHESGYFNIPLLEADGDESKEGVITRFKNWIKKIYEYIKEKVILLWRKIKRKLTGDLGSLKRHLLLRGAFTDRRRITVEIYSKLDDYLNKIETAFNDYEKMSKKIFATETVIEDSEEDKYLSAFKEMDAQYEELKDTINGNLPDFVILTKKDMSDYEKFLNKTDKLVYRGEKILKDLSNNASKINSNSNARALTDGINKLLKSINRTISVLNRDVIARSLSAIKQGGGIVFFDKDTKGFDDGEED